MGDVTRRGMFNRAAGTGLLAILPTGMGAADGPDRDASARIDRDCVLGSGMTAAEADCWEAVARAAQLFFDLPELHPADRPDVADAIHVLQFRLLSRPTYRKYRELHQAAGEKTPG